MKRRHHGCKWRRSSTLLQLSLCAWLASFVSGCNPVASTPKKAVPAPPGPVYAPFEFRNAAPSLGIDFRYDHHPEADRRSILESLGGGVALMDYDGDSDLDLCFPGGGMYGGKNTIRGVPLGLFRNLGDWKFEGIAAAAYADTPRHFSHGAAASDFDRDGFVDLLVTGYGGLQLWRNLGDGTFAEIQEAAGLSDRLWSTSAAWGDVNGDGELDLYVVHYVDWSPANDPACPSPQDPGERDICSPKEFKPLPDALYLSQGDGTFRDASQEAGLRPDGKGLGVVLADLDGDRDLDAYVSNDTTANFLYLNDGTGRFQELAQDHGAAASDRGNMDGSMGVDVLDFNRDGCFDLWVANFEAEDFALYRNLAQARFVHDSRRAGIAAVGTNQVAFGTQCGDFDLDGDNDILVANGHTSLFPTMTERRQRPTTFALDAGFYRSLPARDQSYLARTHVGRGLAMGDLDGDGDLDAAISHLEEPVAVLRNDQRNGNQWLAVRLIGAPANRDAVGARVVLHTDRGDFHAQRCGGRSYLSSPENLIRFGIINGNAVTGLTIAWPSGLDQRVTVADINRVLTVVEGEPGH